jgi:hypothetical protein
MKSAATFNRAKRFIKTFELGNGVTLRAAVVDGKEKIVTVTSPDDVLQGKIADPAKCVEARCLMRYSDENELPHPAYAAWVYKKMAFLLATKKPGKDGLHTAVRYMHNGWGKIREFDRAGNLTPRERLAKLGQWTITLHPPWKTNKIGAYHSRTAEGKKRGAGTNGQAPRKTEHRGYRARLLTLTQWRENMQLAGTAKATA